MNLCVILPTYNERDNIGEIVTREPRNQVHREGLMIDPANVQSPEHRIGDRSRKHAAFGDHIRI